MSILSLCPAHGCLHQIARHKAFCDSCWPSVPEELQDWISRLWGVHGLEDELVRAVKFAVRAVKKARDKS